MVMMESRATKTERTVVKRDIYTQEVEVRRKARTEKKVLRDSYDVQLQRDMTMVLLAQS